MNDRGIPRRKEPALPTSICQDKRLIWWWACASAASPWNKNWRAWNEIRIAHQEQHPNLSKCHKGRSLMYGSAKVPWSFLITKRIDPPKWNLSSRIPRIKPSSSYFQKLHLYNIFRIHSNTRGLGLSEYSVASSTGSSSSSLLVDGHSLGIKFDKYIIPSGKLTCSYWKWWFSIVMLVYQRVNILFLAHVFPSSLSAPPKLALCYSPWSDQKLSVWQWGPAIPPE
jgi:hypothetical protein